MVAIADNRWSRIGQDGQCGVAWFATETNALDYLGFVFGKEKTDFSADNDGRADFLDCQSPPVGLIGLPLRLSGDNLAAAGKIGATAGFKLSETSQSD